MTTEDADHFRLERFRNLLGVYRNTWGFAPQKAAFIWLWQMSETVENTAAEVGRLTGAT